MQLAYLLFVLASTANHSLPNLRVQRNPENSNSTSYCCTLSKRDQQVVFSGNGCRQRSTDGPPLMPQYTQGWLALPQLDPIIMCAKVQTIQDDIVKQCVVYILQMVCRKGLQLITQTFNEESSKLCSDSPFVVGHRTLLCLSNDALWRWPHVDRSIETLVLISQVSA